MHFPYLPVRTSRILTLVLALGAIGACGVAPLAIDLKATAPVIDGFGAATLDPGTTNEAARKLFAQGMGQAYGFNSDEAIRAFKAALAQDPSCAMCAWGIAWQMGPNINSRGRGDLKTAIGYVDYAVKHSENSSARDKALIQSLALRYGHQAARTIAPLPAAMCSTPDSKSTPVNPLDIAYADLLRGMVARFPADPDILVLYAEAEMVTMRTLSWDPKTGKPAGRIGTLTSQLEAAVGRQPDHVGLNHYLIHAADSVHAASRAEAAADRLWKLAPKSPHLLHMPSHTYGHLGRYADATRVNQLAVAAETAQIAELKKQNFNNLAEWSDHNLHFQWFGALMEGRGEFALESARTVAARAKRSDANYFQYLRTLPALTMLHLHRWDAVLAEPMPKTDKGLEILVREMTRGIALVQTGKLADAKLASARTIALEKDIAADKKSDNPTRSVAHYAMDHLIAEILFAEGKIEEALNKQAHAVLEASRAETMEPPYLASGPRLRLGEMQLRAKRHADAEKTFRADLAERPKSGWALNGLHQALVAQGKTEEAAAVQRQLSLSWTLADKGLLRTGP